MKLHKIFLFAATILASAFCSCSEDDNITVGEQDTAKPFVYLSDENKLSVMLEPTAPTEFSFIVGRQDSKGAVSIPLVVTKNTDNVFEVPSTVSFNEGETEAVVTVTFPNAPIGTPCTLTVGFDPEYAGIYKQGTREQSFTVTRVKWNSLGVGSMYEGFIMEDEVDVEILQRDDKPTIFRIVKPFNKYSNLREAASEYIEVTILQPKDKVYDADITQKNLVYFSPTNTGYFHSSYGAYIMMYHPAQFSSLCKESEFTHNTVLSYQEDGKTPGQIQLAPYYYMDGVGGWKYTDADDMVVITFPGFVPKYVADIETDFEYNEEMAEGEFTSGLLGKSSTAALYVGTCTETQDDCDKVFEEKYGKIYKLVSPYAEDYNLTFLVKKGAVSLPEGKKYELQATGLQALGQDVYAKINPDASSYEDGKLVLNITFTNGDEKNEVLYGTYDEVLENINWINLGTGSYTDAFVAPLFGVQAPTYNVEILECEQRPGLYRVMNPYSNSVYPLAEDDCAEDGKFVEIDATDPDGVVLFQQALGFDWGYGEFNIISIGAYYMEYGGYDKATMKRAGYLGTLKDGVITFPVPEDEGVGGLVIMGGKAYNADTDGSFKVVLPSPAAEVQAMNSAVKMSASNKSLNNSMYKFEMPFKYNFTVRKEGKAPEVKRAKFSAPSQIETLNF